MLYSSARLLAASALLGLVLSGCASAPDGQLPPANFVSLQESPGEDYVIGPLDELTVSVWRPARGRSPAAAGSRGGRS